MLTVVVVVVVGLVAVAATIWNLISVAGHKATLVEVVVVVFAFLTRLSSFASVEIIPLARGGGGVGKKK
ncbi:hypothetical protein T4D_6599 [Trichinella pseudospiralis]|uniref:Uncharacterized protein n=1 Tax=Trichinella pseudospiralis TaxID=6337 RepID=A0A0V1FS98_TRIPS|nr:hypothetical protein T4D_6599 [Trichinella pseudospiralis]